MSIPFYNLIALPKEAEDHINQGHKISLPVGESTFCSCNCGLSFRVGIIVDRRTLDGKSILTLTTYTLG